MKLQKLKVLCCFLFLSNAAFADENINFRIEYLKGNLKDKIRAVELASQNGDSSLCFEALDFAIKERAFFTDDKDFEEFTLKALQNLKKENLTTEQKDSVPQYLIDTFKSFPNKEIQLAILEKMEFYPSSANTSMLNSFISGRMQVKAEMDEVTLKAISLLKNSGSTASFSILFLSDILEIWPDYRDQIREAYIPMANSCENEILTIFANVEMSKKLEILNIVNTNDKISKKICGEVAENALSESINTTGESDDNYQDMIKVQQEALHTMAEIKWTRAASLATSYFKIARKDYEEKKISSRQFSQIITDIASIASADTCSVLTKYLDFLNSCKKNNSEPVEAVVLSVINALGGLGNKAAFDCLLYVTYLNYSDEVIEAAKDALAQLKW